MTGRSAFPSILRATALLGSSSVVTIVVGLVSTKAMAVLLGPEGVGYYGLLQSLVSLVSVIAALGIGTGIVRLGANALAHEDAAQVTALRKSAWLLLGGAAVVTAAGLVVLREPIAALMLGGPEYAAGVVLMAGVVVLTLFTDLQTFILNAYHRIGALARLAVLSSIASTAALLAILWGWGTAGIAAAIVAAAAVSWALAWVFLRRETGAPAAPATWAQVRGAGRALLQFGVPWTGSSLVGTGVRYVLPSITLHLLGGEAVGFYRAATTVAVGYLGFLLTAMAQDYYPRVSAASDQPAELVRLVNQQQRLVMLLGVPMILGVLALAPWLIPLVFSAAFAPSVAILQWLLLGDLFRFSSWTMGYVILARSNGRVFLLTETVAGVSTLVASVLGMLWLGLPGLGLGFAVTYAIYLGVVNTVVRREIGFVWSRENKQVLIAATLAGSVLCVLPLAGLEVLRLPLGLAFAGVAGLASLRTIRSELGIRLWPQEFARS